MSQDDAPRSNGVWRWIAATLGFVIISNAGTILATRISDDDIERVAARNFTQWSRDRSMYVIEGRPRLDKVEGQLGALAVVIQQNTVALSRVDTKLVQLLERSVR